MIVGTPRVRNAKLHMGNGRDFIVEKVGKGIYVREAKLDGERLETLAFPVTRMMRGGKLTLEMTENPREARKA